MQPPNQHFLLSAKGKGTQGRMLFSIHCMYCSMPKGASRDEATSNRENQACSVSRYRAMLL